jgi:hypothetical protein
MTNDAMTPEDLLEVLIVAADAKTDEERARVAWRASDYMWSQVPRIGMHQCREFNDLLQQKRWPWVENLWTKEELARMWPDLIR